MKFARRLGVVAALALGLAVAGPLGSVAGAAAPAAAKPKAVATLKIQAASVSVKKKGATDFTAAKDGQKLHEGDTVQTDATGLAEVDYSDDSYTRLDVGTTLKIEKLSDDQGNRQVETSVDVGRTWNRTAALTESQSFEQSGAGATAAVVGTAFALLCDSPDHCDFIGIEHTFRLTSVNGETRVVSPLDACVSDASNLCDEVTHLTPEELLAIQWILRNIGLDTALGYQFPFVGGTVQVQDGQVSFTPSPPTTSTPGTTPVAAPSIDGTCPVLVDSTSSSGGDPTCDPGSTSHAAQTLSLVPAPGITAEDEELVYFQVNQTGASSVGIVAVPQASVGALCALLGSHTSTNPCSSGNPFLAGPAGYETITNNPSDTYNTTTQFDPNTQFVFVPNDNEAPATGSFTETATNAGGTTSQDVTVNVYEDDG